jgi:hypothetical protein
MAEDDDASPNGCARISAGDSAKTLEGIVGLSEPPPIDPRDPADTLLMLDEW